MTDEERKLIAKVAKFEDLLNSMKMIRTRQDSERGKVLVGLRRKLSDQIADIVAMMRPFIERRGDEAAKNEFRRLHSTLLAALALHQANWPAIAVVKAVDDHKYIRSAGAVDEAAEATIRWLRITLISNSPRRS